MSRMCFSEHNIRIQWGNFCQKTQLITHNAFMPGKCMNVQRHTNACLWNLQTRIKILDVWCNCTDKLGIPLVPSGPPKKFNLPFSKYSQNPSTEFQNVLIGTVSTPLLFLTQKKTKKKKTTAQPHHCINPPPTKIQPPIKKLKLKIHQECSKF